MFCYLFYSGAELRRCFPDARHHPLAADGHEQLEQARPRGLAGHGRPQGVWLLLPQTFMNRSGQAVGALARFHRIAPAEILVVHDELDIPPGQLRLKFGGGLGGHNGLKDITAHLGTQDYWRLRVGIGHPGDRNEVVNFVLKPPRREERAAIDDALERALELWPLIEKADWNTAVKRANTRPAPLNSPKPVAEKS